MRGHNIVGDGCVGAARHPPNSRRTLEMLDNLRQTLKLPLYLSTSGQLGQCTDNWTNYRNTLGQLAQQQNNLRTILGQIKDNPITNKATSRTTH